MTIANESLSPARSIAAAAPTVRTLRGAASVGSRVAGGVLAAWLLMGFVLQPTWPTPDWLLLVATFVFMALGQALQLLRKLAPFCALILLYESFRNIAPQLNSRVNFEWMIETDLFLTGSSQLPTVRLQEWLWRGTPSWYDYLYYMVYMAHFVLPVLIVILVWKLGTDREHRVVVTSFVTLTLAGFVTYIAFPAAPPWMASEQGYMPQIERLSDHVYVAMGLAGQTTLWSQISPNPVAAVPSMHAGYATLFAILVIAIFGRRWALPALAYPFIIFVGTVYAGEHYVIDEILGAAYAGAAFIAARLLHRPRCGAFTAQNGATEGWRRQAPATGTR
jgi:hypothetical protein